jgi:hypothetical protein
MAKKSNRKYMPKPAFAGKLKNMKNIKPMGSLLGHQVEGHRDVFFLTNALEDVLVEAPLSRGAHHKIKPTAVLEYKYGVGR